MAISVEEIPSVFRPGYEKARAVDPVRAEAYVRNTMVADPIADTAVASLDGIEPRLGHHFIEAGVNHREDELKEAPRELRDFFAYLDSPPNDVRFQRELALEGSRAFYATADMFMVAIVSKGLVESITTLMGQSFLSTGYTTMQGVQRLRTSLKQVLESMLPGGLEWYGDGWKLTVRARLVHAQARRIIARQPDLWDVEAYGSPVSMAHVGYATASFSSGVLHALSQLGVNLSLPAREGYVHNWRYIGWLMGVPEELLVQNEADGVDLITVARICEPPPNADSIIMAHHFITSAAIGLVGREDEKKLATQTGYIYSVTRALLGNELADELNFPPGRAIGVLPALRWKRRIDKILGRAPSRADNFITLLGATETVLADYELPDGHYA